MSNSIKYIRLSKDDAACLLVDRQSPASSRSLSR